MKFRQPEYDHVFQNNVAMRCVIREPQFRAITMEWFRSSPELLNFVRTKAEPA